MLRLMVGCGECLLRVMNESAGSIIANSMGSHFLLSGNEDHLELGELPSIGYHGDSDWPTKRTYWQMCEVVAQTITELVEHAPTSCDEFGRSMELVGRLRDVEEPPVGIFDI